MFWFHTWVQSGLLLMSKPVWWWPCILYSSWLVIWACPKIKSEVIKFMTVTLELWSNYAAVAAAAATSLALSLALSLVLLLACLSPTSGWQWSEHPLKTEILDSSLLEFLALPLTCCFRQPSAFQVIWRLLCLKIPLVFEFTDCTNTRRLSQAF